MRSQPNGMPNRPATVAKRFTVAMKLRPHVALPRMDSGRVVLGHEIISATRRPAKMTRDATSTTSFFHQEPSDIVMGEIRIASVDEAIIEQLKIFVPIEQIAREVAFE